MPSNTAVNGKTITPSAATGRTKFTSTVMVEITPPTKASAAKKCRSSAPRCRPREMDRCKSTAINAALIALRSRSGPPPSSGRASKPAAR
ncbi:hypothetical protein RF55_24978, partial [Lasius niger]